MISIISILFIKYIYAKIIYKQEEHLNLMQEKHFDLVQDDIKNYDRYFWNKHYKKNSIKTRYKVVISGARHSSNGRVIGDETLLLRMVKAVTNLNWDLRYYQGLQGKEDEIISFNPDFIITTIPKWDLTSNKPLPYKIYSFIPLSSEPFLTKINNELQYTNFNPQIFSISDGIIVTDESFLLFKELYEEISKNSFHGIVGYPGMDYYPYDEKVQPNKMIAYGVNWDHLRGSKRYMDLYYNLAKKNIIDFYGPFIGWINNYSNGWKGILNISKNQSNIDKDPINSINDSVINEIKKHGIVLILNSQSHLNTNLPSLRQFEAAAASSIMISDELSFIHTYFGENALYIKVTDKTTKEIQEQIEKHYEWIQSNPDKVKEMTKNAYDIYLKYFRLEKLFIDIAHMHESVLKNEIIDDSPAKNKLKYNKHIKSIDDIIMPSINASY